MSFELMKEWWEASPLSIWRLQKGNEISAAIGFSPLKANIAELLINGKITELDLRRNDFSSFNTRSQHLYVYISGIMVPKNFQRQGLAKELGCMVMNYLINTCPKQRIELLTWPTNSIAITLCEKFSFQQITNSNLYRRILEVQE